MNGNDVYEEIIYIVTFSERNPGGSVKFEEKEFAIKGSATKFYKRLSKDGHYATVRKETRWIKVEQIT